MESRFGLFAASNSVLPSSFGRPPSPSRTSSTIFESVGTDSSRMSSRFKVTSSSFRGPGSLPKYPCIIRMKRHLENLEGER